MTGSRLGPGGRCLRFIELETRSRIHTRVAATAPTIYGDAAAMDSEADGEDVGGQWCLRPHAGERS
jgi:hypothetical protein